jgi:arylsulfatase A-like enzyme
LCLFLTGHARDVVAAGQKAAERPNIVFILTDDEDFKVHTYLPKVRAVLADRGAVFDNYFVTYSFCCPSRATALRGQYAHNHRVVGNDHPTGGYVKFHAMGSETSTIATWLQDAGYYTALIGKYLNHYDPRVHGVPPGWHEWYSTGYQYFDYWMNENGRPTYYADQPDDYLTDVLTRHTLAVIREQAATGTPFFLYVAPYAPHSPASAAPRHEGLFEDVTYPRGPAFDEPDVSDKPSLVRDLPRLTAEQIEAIDRHHRERLRSMQAIDDMVEAIVETLEASGVLDNTYIVYASDNGFHQGEHRMFHGKTTAYEEDIHVPMIVRGPGVPAATQIEAFVLNNDLAPTFAAMAGVTPPDFVDGRSFLPLFTDPNRPWRQTFMVERRQRETHELTGTARFDALRSAEWTYVEYGNGEREFFDLARDPHQSDNRIDRADPALLATLSSRLAELAACASSACREIEDLPLTPQAPVASAGTSLRRPLGALEPAAVEAVAAPAAEAPSLPPEPSL